MSAMLEDAAAAAAAARRTHDSLCRAGAISQEKMEGVAATLAGVHDDALALQLQADAAYALMCKVAAPPIPQLRQQAAHGVLGAIKAAVRPRLRYVTRRP